MTPDRPSRPTPLRAAFTTPRAIATEHADKAEAEEAISRHMLENQFLLYTARADAEDAGRMAASARPDHQEWEELVGLAAPYGGNMRDAQRLARGEAPLGFPPPPPPPFAYVIEIEFDDSVHLATTDARTKSDQLELSRENPEWDLLWLPDGISAGACFRVVTCRDLQGHFNWLGSYRVYGQPRRPAS
jgi:hypothetical protein